MRDEYAFEFQTSQERFGKRSNEALSEGVVAFLATPSRSNNTLTTSTRCVVGRISVLEYREDTPPRIVSPARRQLDDHLNSRDAVE